jgi:hypothetical protein
MKKKDYELIGVFSYKNLEDLLFWLPLVFEDISEDDVDEIEVHLFKKLDKRKISYYNINKKVNGGN